MIKSDVLYYFEQAEYHTWLKLKLCESWISTPSELAPYATKELEQIKRALYRNTIFGLMEAGVSDCVFCD